MTYFPPVCFSKDALLRTQPLTFVVNFLRISYEKLAIILWEKAFPYLIPLLKISPLCCAGCEILLLYILVLVVLYFIIYPFSFGFGGLRGVGVVINCQPNVGKRNLLLFTDDNLFLFV